METKSKNKRILKVLGILVFLFACFALYWVHYLHMAHSTYENYYAFRGCVSEVEKTDTYARCKLSDGNVIKLVKVNNKWFLAGDFGW